MRHIYSLAGLLALTAVLHAGDAAPPDKALLVVKLPASAVLTIGTSSTMQTGPERWFLSPKLEPGKTYSYSLSASWTENGKQQERTLTGDVSAGKRTVVDFNAPPVEKIKAPPKKAEAEKADELKSKWAKVRATESDLFAAEITTLRAEADWRRADALWRMRQPAIASEEYAAIMLAWQKYVQEEINKREAYKQARRQAGLADLPKSRTFEFTYAATIKDLPKDKIARIWLPLPHNSREQRASLVSKEVPVEPVVGVEKLYRNRMFYLEAKGEVRLKLVFNIMRREVEADMIGYAPPAEGESLARFLQPDALVPLGGKSLTLIKDKKLPADQVADAKVFYDVINNHMRYSKEGVGWGRGDADWACDSKFGNCTDFHSMFIALARAEKIPAKFEIGFSLPEKRGEGSIGGYHCWAWFLPKDKGWFPVDISEANRHPAMVNYYFGNLTENRVHFTTGRDLDLVPKQAGKPLNYFIYPYVEVDGQPLPPERVVCSFRYRDVPVDASGKKN